MVERARGPARIEAASQGPRSGESDRGATGADTSAGLPGSVPWPLHAAGIGGALLFVGLIAWYGVGSVLGGLAVAGIGLLLPPLYRFVPITCDVIAWRMLFPRGRRPRFGTLLRLTWYGDAVDTLLPLAQVGGELVRAHALTRLGVRGDLAGASVVVTLTAGTVTQLLFALIGLALLAARGDAPDAIGLAVLGIVLAAALVAGFYLAQRRGFFALLIRFLGPLVNRATWERFAGGAAALDRTLDALYRKRRIVLVCACWKLASWLLGSIEVWIALQLIGVPVSLVDAIILESLIEAVRGAAFLVPGALGVQEGGLVLLGALVGLPPNVALSLSLVKRTRELAVGIPGLVALSTVEGVRLFASPKTRERSFR